MPAGKPAGMANPYSQDVRDRMVRAALAGHSRHTTVCGPPAPPGAFPYYCATQQLFINLGERFRRLQVSRKIKAKELGGTGRAR